MKPEDSETMVFTTTFDLFNFNRMLFGLSNPYSTFQRLRQSSTNDYIFKLLFIFLDDILLFSSSIEKHNVKLERMFQRLLSTGLKLNKYTFLRRPSRI